MRLYKAVPCLLVLVVVSRGACAASWKVAFGGCTFTGDTNGSALVRNGSCPTHGGTLGLTGKGITAVPADAFKGMVKMT